MFSCPLCERQYDSKSSLRRHVKNHQTAPHVCPVCHIGFARKDILSRHARIHSNPAGPSSHNSGRLRSHTACSNCRTARQKCDGGNPCSLCRQTGQDCVYEAAGGRISAAVDPWSTDATLLRPSLSAGAAYGGDLPSAQSSQPPSRGVQSEPATTSKAIATDVETSEESMQNLSWPWLHENMFLQGNTGYSYPETAPWSSEYLGMDLDPILDMQTEAPSGIFPANIGSSQVASGSNDDTQLQTWEEPHDNTILQQLVARLVQVALEQSRLPAARRTMHLYMNGMENEIERAFGFEQSNDNLTFCEKCIKLYKERFATHVSFICYYFSQPSDLHPLLLLVICSVGVMYGDAGHVKLGAILHEELRDCLGEPMFDLESAEMDAVSIAKARALCRGSMLYFGHNMAFSYAQHLGSVLTAQLRRMGCFHGDAGFSASPLPQDAAPEALRAFLDRWHMNESKKRVAFVALTLESYASMLLNARPLISAEELDLYTPCAAYLWETQFPSDPAFVAAIKQEDLSTTTERVFFSDLVRICLEKDELLPQLGALDQELLILALQEHTWRVISNLTLLGRIVSPINIDTIDTGLDVKDKISPGEKRAYRENFLAEPVRAAPLGRHNNSDHLLGYSRKMQQLQTITYRVTNALRKVDRQVTISLSSPVRSLSERSSLMASRLLYHLTFLRLFTPLEKLHTLAYRVNDTTIGEDDELVRDIWKWAMSENAAVALRHVLSLWNLLHAETERPANARASLTFIALLAVHNAAICIWIYAGTHNRISVRDNFNERFVLGARFEDSELAVLRPNSRLLLENFINLFDQMSPAWPARDSFRAAVARLAQIECPIVPKGDLEGYAYHRARRDSST